MKICYSMNTWQAKINAGWCDNAGAFTHNSRVDNPQFCHNETAMLGYLLIWKLCSLVMKNSKQKMKERHEWGSAYIAQKKLMSWMSPCWTQSWQFGHAGKTWPINFKRTSRWQKRTHKTHRRSCVLRVLFWPHLVVRLEFIGPCWTILPLLSLLKK